MRWLVFAAACAIPLPVAGQTDEADFEWGTRRSVFSFTRLAQKASRAKQTLVLPAAQKTWRNDNRREGGREFNYWAAIRKEEIARLTAIYRAENKRVLNAAKARAAASHGFNAAKQEETTHRSGGNPGAETGPRTAKADYGGRWSKDVLSQVAAAATKQLESAGNKVQGAAKRMGGAIEESFLPSRRSNVPGSSAVILALLAIFLVPSLAGVLLAAAFLNLRAGHHFRGAGFGAMGLLLSVLIYAAAFHRSGLPSRQELLTECRKTAVSITACVQELDDSGAVITSLRSSGGRIAETDHEGCAFLFTKNRGGLSCGQNFTSVAYYVGSKRIYNAFGLAADMPAYTDSLEEAVQYREEKGIEGGWWRKLLRPFVNG